MSILSALTFDTKNVSMKGLRRLNFVLAGLSIIEGLVILLTSHADTATRAVQTSFLSRDEIASQSTGQTVLFDATKHLFDLNLAYVVAAFLFVGAAASLLAATRRQKSYESGLANSANGFRWHSYLFSVTLMCLAAAIFIGIGELSLLLGIALASIAACTAARLYESAAGKTARGFLHSPLGLLASLVPVSSMAIYLWGALIYGEAPKVAQYLVFALVVIYLGFLLFWSLRPRVAAKEYAGLERSYLLLSFIAQSAIAWLIYIGVR